MPLVKTKLKADLRVLFKALSKEEDPEKAMEKLTDGLATIIDSYIKTATVTGITTVVSGVAGPVPVVGTGTQVLGTGKLI